MSIWTSEAKAARALAGLLLLSACLETGETQKPAVRAVALGGGAVVLDAPRGYCIDPDSLRQRSGRVALLASCVSLTGVPGIVVAPAVMTVSVLPHAAAAPTPESLARPLAPARIGASGTQDGLVYVQILEGGEAVLPGGDPRHWRGARIVAGHLAGLAVYAPEGSSLTGPDGRGLLRDLAAGLSARAIVPAIR
ncbi:MAG: hypothetical protein IBX58_03170 [Roseovarius sp.]|nr:hypothetical protein [Roseovarius sp.]